MSHRHTPTNRKSSFRKQLLNAAEQYFHPLVFMYYKVQSIVRPIVDDVKLRYWVYKLENKWNKSLYADMVTYPYGSVKRNMMHSLVKREAGMMQEIQPNHINLDIVASVAKRLVEVSDLVGVQPLSGPVGLVYHMVYTLEDGSPVTDFSSCNGLKLSIVSRAVEARTRKLQATWSMELSQDLSTLHGMNVHDEVKSILGTELASEHIAAILHDLTTAATHSFDYTINPSVDSWKKIGNETGFMINRVANRIAQASRRGAGNWAIVSPTVLMYLQSSEMFEPDTGKYHVDEYFNLVGKMSNGIKIYCSKYVPDNKILMGYKGTSEVDTGYIYSPYRIAFSSGMVMDELSFQPLLTSVTRYATSSSACDPFTNGNYYGIITVNQMLTENITDVESGN